jgi:hypothetical protein
MPGTCAPAVITAPLRAGTPRHGTKDASGDTGTSHTLPGRLYIVQCEWCPEAFAAHTKVEAMAMFRKHEAEMSTAVDNPVDKVTPAAGGILPGPPPDSAGIVIQLSTGTFGTPAQVAAQLNAQLLTTRGFTR